MKRTLVIVDLQYDFLEGGSLAVKGANTDYVDRVEKIRPFFEQVILTADYHPKDHISFITFPPHCVEGTHGADVAVAKGDELLLKGEDVARDEFSAFGNGKNIDNIIGDEVYVLGLAGDICVKETLIDLLQFSPTKKLFAIVDLIYSVDGTSYHQVDYFDGKVEFITSDQLIN
jgi:nicotinamidase/pyrazinamidase